MADNVCRNCKWASWQMTNHAPPRIHKGKAGQCVYPLERIAMPQAAAVARREIEYYSVFKVKPTIFYGNDAQCRVWERR